MWLGSCRVRLISERAISFPQGHHFFFIFLSPFLLIVLPLSSLLPHFRDRVDPLDVLKALRRSGKHAVQKLARLTSERGRGSRQVWSRKCASGKIHQRRAHLGEDCFCCMELMLPSL